MIVSCPFFSDSAFSFSTERRNNLHFFPNFLIWLHFLPRTNSGEKGTLETVSGALFAVTLKGALRDVLAAERASVASRTDAAARVAAAAAFLLPLFAVTLK